MVENAKIETKAPLPLSDPIAKNYYTKCAFSCAHRASRIAPTNAWAEYSEHGLYYSPNVGKSESWRHKARGAPYPFSVSLAQIGFVICTSSYEDRVQARFSSATSSVGRLTLSQQITSHKCHPLMHGFLLLHNVTRKLVFYPNSHFRLLSRC